MQHSIPSRKHVILAALMAASVTGHAALVYYGDPGITVTGATVVEVGQETAYNTAPNHSTPFIIANNLVKQSGSTFASSSIGGFGPEWTVDYLYPSDTSQTVTPWLPTSSSTEYVGVTFSSAVDNIRYVGFGNEYTNRSCGSYTIQYTVDGTNWVDAGNLSSISEGNIVGRNLFDIGEHDGVLGVRIDGYAFTDRGAPSISVSELEVYSAVSVPEPLSLGLLALGGMGLLVRRGRT